MSKDQLVHHGNKRQFQSIIRDVFLGTTLLVCQMGNTGPCGILAAGFIMQPPFIFAAAFPAIDPAGKAISVLISPGVMTIPFFPSTLFQNRIGQFKLFLADDCFMVVLHQVLVKFSPVLMAVKAVICIGLLEQDITGIFLIPDDAVNSTRRPMPATLGSNAPFIQFIGNRMGTFPCQRIRKNLSHNLCLFRHDYHFPIHVGIAVWGIGNNEGAILKPPLDTPLLILRNRYGLTFCQAA